MSKPMTLARLLLRLHTGAGDADTTSALEALVAWNGDGATWVDQASPLRRLVAKTHGARMGAHVVRILKAERYDDDPELYADCVIAADDFIQRWNRARINLVAS